MGGCNYSIMGLSLGGCTYHRATFVSEVATNTGPCWEVATVKGLSSGGYHYAGAVRKVDSSCFSCLGTYAPTMNA
jgi:hypothetical protein